MSNNRLTRMNQWGSIIYIGPDKKGIYRGIGDYAENLTTQQIELIMKRLYFFEEAYEYILEGFEHE